MMSGSNPLEAFDNSGDNWITYQFASTSEPGTFWVYMYNIITAEIDPIKPCKGFRFHEGQCCHVEAILSGNRKIKRTKAQVMDALREYKAANPIPKDIRGVRATSIKAYYNGELYPQAMKVLEYLIRSGEGGETIADISEDLKIRTASTSGRIGDLRQLCLIEEAGRTNSRKTNKSGILWRAIKDLRDNPDRRKGGFY